MTIVFINGVPDTPALWQPLIDALKLNAKDYLAPALPGFVTPAPSGFSGSKDAYAEWLIGVLEDEYKISGPIDLVGHDWGALFCVRAASLRPDLIRSWVAINAVPSTDYQWHKVALYWQKPVIGDLMMLLTGKSEVKKRLMATGMPEAVAETESQNWGPSIKRSLLRLYRTAYGLADWSVGLEKLPRNGLVIWGLHDPFISVEFGERFCEENGFPLEVLEGSGHWTVCQRPKRVANMLKRHWAS